MTPVYLSLDFFLQDWIRPDGTANPNGVVWLCLLPHVQHDPLTLSLEDHLPRYVQDLGLTKNFSFSFTTPSSPKLVPVPFPSDADIEVVLEGPTGEVKQIVNRRTTSLPVSSSGWSTIYKDNHSLDEAPSSAVLHEGPFAIAYNQALQEQWQHFNEPGRTVSTEIGQMLQLAYWGGTKRRIASGSIGSLNGVDLMTLDPQGFRGIVTNLHSLGGHFFRIGRRSDVDTLSKVTKLSLILNDKSPQPQLLRTDGSVWASTIRIFFSSLTKNIPSAAVGSYWNADFAKRVYVSTPLIVFVPQHVGGAMWWRRRSDRNSQAPELKPQHCRQLTVFPRTTIENPNSLPPLLRWNLFATFEIRLDPYRDAPSSAAGQTLVQVRPLLRDRRRFYDEVQVQLARDRNWFSGPTKPTFTAPNGAALGNLSFVFTEKLPWDGEALSRRPRDRSKSSDREL
jgi:hypothetical protein